MGLEEDPVDSNLDDLEEIVKSYPTLDIHAPSLPRIEHLMQAAQSDVEVQLPPIVNKAEYGLHIDLKKSNVRGFEQYHYAGYTFVNSEIEKEESILDLQIDDKDSTNIEIGKIKHLGNVTYQVRLENRLANLDSDTKPKTEHFSPKEIASSKFADYVILLEQTEKRLREQIPKYFQLRPSPSDTEPY